MKTRAGILRNTVTVGAFTALSRMLGLVREMFQARLIGAGMEQSSFTLAFALPNMARKLFGEGALTAAFIPVFKETLARGDRARAERLARSVVTTVVAMLSAGVVLSLLSIGAVLRVDAVGAWAETERGALTVRLVSILLPYMVFICGAAFGMGVLNAVGRFKASAFMPCLLNVCWIASLAALSFFPGVPVTRRVQWVAAAILAAGAIQMAFLFLRVRAAGFSLRPFFGGWRDGDVRLVWANLAIGAVGAGAVQINYLLDQVLAQLANPWAAGVIGYAERLMDLPLGVVGVAFGTVLLPTFAGFFSRADAAGARAAFGSSLRSMMCVMLPSAAGLCALAPEITSVVYEGDAFDATAGVRVSRAVAVYSAGLAFFAFQKMLVPWFQAQKDMKTPLRVSLATVVLNAALNVLSVGVLPVEWRHVGFAASTVACAGVGCALFLAAARRRNGSLGLGASAPALAKMLLSAGVMGAAVHCAKDAFARLTDVPLFSLAASVVFGALVYAACLLALSGGGAVAFLRRRACVAALVLAAAGAFAAPARAAVDLGVHFSDPAAWEESAVDFAVDRRDDGFVFASQKRDIVNCLRRGAATWFGHEVWESRLYYADGRLSRVELSLYNKGDDRRGEGMSAAAFDALVRSIAARAAPGAKRLPEARKKEIKGGYQFIRRWPKASPALELTWGETGKNAADRALSFVRLVLTQETKRRPAGAKRTVSSRDAEAKAKANVRTGPDGDVWIATVPMVDQGRKGYCSVAVTERVLRYFGQTIDEHELAQMAGSTASGGTSAAAAKETVRAVGSKCRLAYGEIVSFGLTYQDVVKDVERYNKAAKAAKKERLSIDDHLRGRTLDVGGLRAAMDPKVLKTMRTKDARYRKFLSSVRRQIDAGNPVIWNVTLGIYPEPEIPQSRGGHTRLIVGYNSRTKEILYSDSWGAGHELKRMPEEWAFAITDEAFFLRPL